MRSLVFYISRSQLNEITTIIISFIGYYRMVSQNIFSVLVTSLKCYSCSADYGKSCDPPQIETCSPQQVCLTMAYKEVFENVAEPKFIKRCANGWERCAENCEKNDDTSFDCKVSLFFFSFLNQVHKKQPYKTLTLNWQKQVAGANK